MPRHASDLFGLQHAERRNFVPLRYGLRSDAHQTREGCLPSRIPDRTLQSFCFAIHSSELKHGFT
jgi:hypothetical protein